jgi:hypothetical protein
MRKLRIERDRVLEDDGSTAAVGIVPSDVADLQEHCGQALRAGIEAEIQCHGQKVS